MPSGRPRKATEVLREQGAYKSNPRRENKQEPKPNKIAPDKPATVEDDPIASQKWDSLCILLEQCGLLADTDSDLMELFCITFSQYRRLLKQINTTGFTIVTRDPQTNNPVVKRNPIMIEYRNIADLLRRLIPEFGLSPSSRSRLVSTRKEEKSEFQKWLERGKDLN
jgi:P27 family predicted phage terminase small subunit